MAEDHDRHTTDYDDQPEAHEVDDQPKRGPRPIQYLAPQSPSGPAPFPPQSPQHHQNNYPNQQHPQQQYPPQNPPPFQSQQPPYYQQQPQHFPPQNNYANAAPPSTPSQPPQGYNGMPQQQQQPYPEQGGYNKPNYQSPQQQQYQPQQPQKNYNYAPSAAQGVPTNNYTPQGMPVRNMNGMQPFGTEPWQTGLFDCMDDPNNAIMTLFVPCVTYGQIAEVVDNGTTSCATSGLIYGLVAVFTWVPFIMSCTYRTKIRSKYGLVETPAPDWVTHLFCDLCALCQEYRELNIRGLDPSIGWQGNVARSMQQPNMMAPPPNHMMR